jgi:putative ABC transport system substrate-binding protein
MIGRRRFALVLAALAVGAHAEAQPARVWRIGFLSARRRPPSLDDDYYGAFPRRMRELGYVDGRNVAYEWRFADGDYGRLASMAGELARMKVDAMLALSLVGAQAAQKATTTIPIVFVVSADPVRAKLVASLARPGGNLTGIHNLSADLTPKQLELLAHAVPRLERVAMLVNPGNDAHAGLATALEKSGRASGRSIVTVHAATAQEIEPAVATAARQRAGALVVALDPLFIQQQREIAQAALRHGLPTVFSYADAADAGGFLSYGQDQREIYVRAAEFVDRILKGTRPAEMPVEQPTRIALVVNLRTARALGLAPPASLLSAADRLIE